MSATQRPTTVNRKIYVKFINKCRTKNKSIREELEKLLVLYVKKGELFT